MLVESSSGQKNRFEDSWGTYVRATGLEPEFLRSEQLNKPTAHVQIVQIDFNVFDRK